MIVLAVKETTYVKLGGKYFPYATEEKSVIAKESDVTILPDGLALKDVSSGKLYAFRFEEIQSCNLFGVPV